MKKIFAFLVMFFGVFTLSACKCDKDDITKASLSIGDMNATTYEEVTMSYLEAMIEDDETFIVYVYNPLCQGCKLFKPVIEGVIQEKHLKIYAIQDTNVSKQHELYSLRTTPAFALYNNGELVFKTVYDDNKDYFDTKEGFISFLDKYTNLPTLYYISKDQLTAKIENNEEFVVYYSRSSCSDCGYLNTHFLKDYLNKNVNTKHFYVIETDAEGIRYNGGEYDATQWQEFKDTYGLSNVNNPKGHGVGYVPTLQYYKNGEIEDMMVYFNDGTYVLNEDDTYSIRIDMSYYNDNPYLNQLIKASEYKEKLAPFYNQKLEAFLNAYLTK